ncbi:hypothetical protein LOD99_5491 [Oopsacas minuta]|uniref:Uncharacterized protein n=1 Tax=Oopsacas minuta TaxID=111878 RepID=A0AAV7JS05_9METZ|nr:hypothetical protein LOD99_5491 [Oopsacas minuta]
MGKYDFRSTHITISNPRKRISLDPEFSSLVTDSENRNFLEQIVTESRRHILECHMKTSRSRLGVLLEHVDFLAEREKIEPKQLLALALELVSKKSYDRDISDICREIIDKGSFSGVLNKIQISECAYILDSLEIGASKYTNLKRILKDTLGNDMFYNSSPNSPFCFRPVALITLKEEYSNVKLIMNTIVNPQTDHIIQDGLSFIGGHTQFEIIRFLFDTKMAGLLDGAGVPSCHLCTATDSQITSLEWAILVSY